MSKRMLPTASFWSDYWRFLKPYRPMLVQAVIWTVVMQGLGLVDASMCMKVVEKAMKDQSYVLQNIWFIAAVLFFALCGFGVIKYFKDTRASRVTGAIYRDVQQSAYDKLLRLPMSFHLGTNSGELMGKITRGTGKIMDTTFFLLFEMMPLLIQTVLTAAALLVLRPFAVLVLVPTVAVFARLTDYLKRKTMASRHLRHEHDDRADRRVGQSIYNVATVQGNNMEQYESDISRYHRGEFHRLFLEELEMTAMMDIGRNAIISFGRVWMLMLCIRGMCSVEISAPTLFLVMMLAEGVFKSCYAFGRMYDRVMDAQEPVQKVLDLMAVPDGDPDPENPEVLVPQTARRIELHDVGYAYPKDGDTQPMVMALREVSLTIRPGEMLGIVGHSGSGKSTLAKLLLGFYRPSIGVVHIDGVDIRRLKRADLRRCFGYVPQEVDLFDDTIGANIGYSKPDATDKEIVAAAKAAHAHDFIMEAGGYDTMLGNRGMKLSGGQRQRIGIARALLTKPSILIFDEATSSVDPETIWAIKQAIEDLRGGCTMIVISHQLSTIQNASRIAVIKKGRVEAVGKHHDLLKTNPTYQKLVRIQQRLDEGLQVQMTRPMVS